ncbi:AbrB/MazE/SpoVT family DNA-binding domain-containing protein [Candidatus Woesearchaeota archaeon]|nr:AbrB/MazE/SpoVT family DNA-binding domain-containing protein [Candidatus Woesearchaeota archaeon]
MVKVVAFKGQYRITIPKELAEFKGWKPGMRLRFVELPDGTVVLKEIKEEANEKTKSKQKEK